VALKYCIIQISGTKVLQNSIYCYKSITKFQDLACKNFPVQAAECKEFLRHKSVMIEPSIVLKVLGLLALLVQKYKY
jgi:hypothetical protein